MKNQRRSFLKIIGGLAASLVLLPARIAQARKLAISLDKIPQLKEVGGSTTLKINGQPVIFVRDSPKSVRALDPTCTHKKCKVKYNPETTNFHCKCHKSAYSIDGTVLGGPAPAPLTKFRSKLDLKKNRVLLEIPDKK